MNGPMRRRREKDGEKCLLIYINDLDRGDDLLYPSQLRKVMISVHLSVCLFPLRCFLSLYLSLSLSLYLIIAYISPRSI